MNHKTYNTNTAGFTGVGFHIRKNKFVASITIYGKKIYLGDFDDIDDAIKARKDAEEKYFGEFKRKEVNL